MSYEFYNTNLFFVEGFVFGGGKGDIKGIARTVSILVTI